MNEDEVVKKKLDEAAKKLFEDEWLRFSAGLTGSTTEILLIRRTCSLWFGLGRWAAAKEMRVFHKEALRHLEDTAGYHDFPPSVN